MPFFVTSFLKPVRNTLSLFLAPFPLICLCRLWTGGVASAPPIFRLAFNFVRSDCGVRGAEAAVTVVDAVAAAAAAAAAVTGVAAVGICKPSFSAIASKYSFR